MTDESGDSINGTVVKVPIEDRYIYWSPEGEPINLWEWVEYCKSDWHKRVAETLIGRVRISTVWIGIDMSCGMGERKIFETMAFMDALPSQYRASEPSTWFETLGQWRWDTREHALWGHRAVVNLASLNGLRGREIHNLPPWLSWMME
jgi:hypothetical protein